MKPLPIVDPMIETEDLLFDWYENSNEASEARDFWNTAEKLIVDGSIVHSIMKFNQDLDSMNEPPIGHDTWRQYWENDLSDIAGLVTL